MHIQLLRVSEFDEKFVCFWTEVVVQNITFVDYFMR